MELGKLDRCRENLENELEDLLPAEKMTFFRSFSNTMDLIRFGRKTSHRERFMFAELGK